MIDRIPWPKIGHAALDFAAAYAAVVLALFIVDGADPWAVSATELRAWSAAGLAATLPVVVTALRRGGAYGRGSDARPEPEPPAGVDIGG